MTLEKLEYTGNDGIVEIDIEAMTQKEAECIKDLINDAIIEHTEFQRHR